MIDVLFISSNTLPVSAIAETVPTLVVDGARVAYGACFPEPELEDQLGGIGLAEIHGLPRSNLRRAVDLRFGERVWTRCRTDKWLRAKARAAHVIVAVDEGAIYTVWQLAQRNRTAKAVNGFAPAISAVRELTKLDKVPAPRTTLPPSLIARDFGRAVKRLPAAAARVLTARPIMRRDLGAKLWRVPLRAPGVPAKLRLATGSRVAEAMRWAGKHTGAAYALALTADKLDDPKTKAELLYEAAQIEYGRGIVSKHTDKAVRALLAYADLLQVDERYLEAAGNLQRAMVLSFHRVAHIDGLTSPLTKNPARFIKPFHESRAMQTVTAPRGRRLPAAIPPAHRPLRLLVMTSANDNFLPHILQRYRAHPCVEVRFLDTVTQTGLKRVSWADRRIMQERLGGDPGYAAEVEGLMRPYLDWADTVFVDWCVGPPAMITEIDPGDTRIIVRLHSYEAFTRWPHLVDWSRVDDLVFVAEHLKGLTTELVPQLRGPGAPRTPVVYNAVDLSSFAREKSPEARFNLGLVGVGQVVKDPLWAVEVLRALRETDDRYRLIMIGADMDRDFSPATRKYRNKMEQALGPLVESGAVVRLGATSDVASKLPDVGFILSTSVRESAHLGLMEGVASGAVPVVRDWPFFAGSTYGGARTVFPESWVVDTPEAAARRIMRINADEEGWRNSAKLAAEHAISTWDWSVVSRDFDELLFGEPR
ncbi:glycosyltransferase family 4 protein [Glycomyces sp. YM15]|uniref:glycosyltransferase family 4 protein n=1 Tax=Glycomyces sp. YM15 TaxID=2800446 RepID=UPI001964B914|nr:glycosyltransferase family 4 protein [Glycomyces sp. YM15]